MMVVAEFVDVFEPVAKKLSLFRLIVVAAG
jgi:hypothetical protein